MNDPLGPSGRAALWLLLVAAVGGCAIFTTPEAPADPGDEPVEDGGMMAGPFEQGMAQGLEGMVQEALQIQV